MSEPPTPSKGPTKRRGLALPPRGQALARLQDLEQETEPAAAMPSQPGEAIISEEGSNAVNTARSNAVSQEGSNAALNDGNAEQSSEQVGASASTDAPPDLHIQAPSVSVSTLPVRVGSGHQTAARAPREPTTRITVDMPDSLHRKISLLSVETRRSIKDLVIEALATAYFGTDETNG